jgi:hypothetical protein
MDQATNRADPKVTACPGAATSTFAESSSASSRSRSDWSTADPAAIFGARSPGCCCLPRPVPQPSVHVKLRQQVGVLQTIADLAGRVTGTRIPLAVSSCSQRMNTSHRGRGPGHFRDRRRNGRAQDSRQELSAQTGKPVTRPVSSPRRIARAFEPFSAALCLFPVSWHHRRMSWILSR